MVVAEVSKNEDIADTTQPLLVALRVANMSYAGLTPVIISVFLIM